MKNLPHMEINSAPEVVNTSSSQQGVAKALTDLAGKEPHYDGVTIEEMRNNPLYERVSSLDKIGLAEKKIAEAAHAVSKSKFVRELNRKMQHPAKNS